MNENKHLWKHLYNSHFVMCDYTTNMTLKTKIYSLSFIAFVEDIKSIETYANMW